MCISPQSERPTQKTLLYPQYSSLTNPNDRFNFGHIEFIMLGELSNRHTIGYVGSELWKESEEVWRIILSWKTEKSEGFLEERKVNGIRCTTEVQDSNKGMHVSEFATKKPMFSSVRYIYIFGRQALKLIAVTQR